MWEHTIKSYIKHGVADEDSIIKKIEEKVSYGFEYRKTLRQFDGYDRILTFSSGEEMNLEIESINPYKGIGKKWIERGSIHRDDFTRGLSIPSRKIEKEKISWDCYIKIAGNSFWFIEKEIFLENSIEEQYWNISQVKNDNDRFYLLKWEISDRKDIFLLKKEGNLIIDDWNALSKFFENWKRKQ